ncbi:hypothetical protein [Spirosoma utsteinense]|uniref:Uncharacterized protein n=1 Tax=Spirosoma utsteinense TaxID=2585773 RepID=A0ABR6W3P7_9BACT|nr:hypothetical protein [Spirosoma utsteinense]MBC3784752.1 hypothetical protein [Spirosoma utsteinense]MBC3791212.1 hypothetical protein [Spirosoma utsteinense]
MRFISIYQQSKKVLAKGFPTEKLALDFLGWGYEDNDLAPFGIYDSLLSQASLYQHDNEPVLCTDPDLIEQVALTYLASSDRQQKAVR